jgi:hypothetical protein
MATKIEYTEYARKRLQERQIPETWIAEIIAHGDRYRDAQSGRLVAVGRQRYQGKERDIMVAFEESNSQITVVTSSALKESQRQRRIQVRRWIPA